MNRRILLPLFCLLLLLVPGNSWAQFAQRGSLSGTVFDASGAVVPGAQVTLLDVAQNHTRQIKTDEAGHFEFDNLTAGQYQLTAAGPGFQTSKSEAITVNIGASSNYDFRLRPGAEQQTVTVTAEAAGLETEHISVDTNVTARQLEELPLNGRNFTSLAALAPGVSTYPQANVNPGGTYAVGAMFAVGGTQFTAGGAPQGSRDSGFYVNGVNVNDNYESSLSFAPSAEALGTGTVQVTDFSAAIGHDIASLTMQTKGGSNKFHGAVYDYLENDAINAFNPWANAVQIITATPSAKPVLKRNQFGGNLGGPIPIPGFKDKFFFFVNLEDFKEHDGNQLVAVSVPSAAELTGDFSELLGTNPNPVQLYNPFFTTYNPDGSSTRPPILNNRLDLATRPDGSPLIDPSSAALLKALWPSPTNPSVPSNQVNFTAYQTPGISNWHLDTRFDAKITANDSMFVTWSKSSGNTTLTGGLTPNQLHNFPLQDKSFLVTVNYLHIFSPHITNEFIFGTGDGYLVTIQPGQLGYYNGSSNPFNSLFQNTGTGITHGVLSVYDTDYRYASAGTGEIFRAENESYQVSDNLDWVFGRHSLSMGVNYFRKSEIDWDIQRNVSFGGFSSSGSDLGHLGGDGIADLEMGIPGNMWVRYTINGGSPTSPDYNILFPSWGFYVNDKYRITPTLTVSAGLRYELDIPDYTANPLAAPCCAIYTPTADGGVLKYPGIAPGLSNQYLSASKTAFAPRLSIAYNVRPRTIIRAGYGLFYDTGASQISDKVGNAIYGTSAAVNYSVNNTTLGYLTTLDTPHQTLADIFPAAQTTTLGTFPVSTGKGEGYSGDGFYTSITYLDQKSTRLPYLQRMLLDVQQQVASHDVVTISYAGAQGRRGLNYVNTNLPPYRTGWDPSTNGFNDARPNNIGRFGDIFVQRQNINSFYNALIVQYRHDFSRNFQITSSYTWSKTVSDYPWVNALGNNGTSGGGTGGFQYSNLYNRGESNQSHPQRFVFSGIWSPNYGSSWPKYAKLPLTGWRLTGILTFESGDALTVYNGGPGTPCPASASTSVCPTGFGSSAYDGDRFDELFVSGNPNIGHGDKSFSRQFNTSAFSIPPNNVRGNSGLGTVRGPGQNNVDLSLAKTFPITERVRFELRGDAFNAFNHTQWTGVNTTFPSGDVLFPFGQVNGAREARIVQVAAKLAF